ncbi:MAG TPA: hypothetical protein VMY37_26710 [Thermoguttaceae bacterium]|nr:hypothetical protein [Thermoguttaceae bacterium]
MKCYHHRETEAVAVCTYCGKAVCSECENESDSHRITCCAPCAEAGKRDDVFRNAVREHFAATGRSYRVLSIVLSLVGALIAVGGIALVPVVFLYLERFDPVAFGLDVVLILLGVICLAGSRSLSSIAKRYQDIVRRM